MDQPVEASPQQVAVALLSLTPEHPASRAAMTTSCACFSWIGCPICTAVPAISAGVAILRSGMSAIRFAVAASSLRMFAVTVRKPA